MVQYDYFFTGVDEGDHCSHHGLGSAAGNSDFGFRVNVQIEKLFALVGDSLTQRLVAPGNGILIDVVKDGLGHRFFQLGGTGKIR